MSIINTRPLAGASGNQVTGYNLTKSLRTRASASASLSKTFGVAPTSRTTSTMSMWVKRGALTVSSSSTIFGTASNYEYAYFNSSDQLRIGGPYSSAQQGVLVTTQVFRDPSAWYHIVVVYDTTNATAANRIRLYVNGTQVTSFSTQTNSNQNNTTTEWLNSGTGSAIASTGGGTYFDGYIAEVNVVDGQALTPSSFGENDTITGVWKPKRYTGTYGTNGFYLPFTDVATTSGSNAGLGKDFSGNGNYWTTNNISVTAGATYDSMTDVPTLTSATAANYCVGNPLSLGANASLADGNLKGTLTGSGGWGATFNGFTSGKWYYEATVTANSGNSMWIGWLSDAYAKNDNSWSYSTSVLMYGSNGNKGDNTSYGATYTTNDVIGVALDLDGGTVTFYKNNTSQGTAFSSISVSAVWRPVISGGGTGTSIAMNFGQQGFKYTPPTGYLALNTYNLPDSTIVAGNKVMDATLYTGTSAAQNIVNAAGFKPDMVWTKSRNNATYHGITDSVRGISKAVFPNAGDVESSSAGDYVTAFNTNGFGVNTGSVSGLSGYTYVGWQWQAGQGTTSSNTSGSITSTVSVNASAGFSIVTYTGNGSSPATIGHGLGVAPKFVLVKCLSNNESWNVYHSTIAAGYNVRLNATNGLINENNYNTFTSSVLSVNGNDPVNHSAWTYVAYCWAEIAGFSKFGSYTGNGSSDGPFVYTGFRPKFWMVKRTDAASTWFLLDSSRNLYNVEDRPLLPNATDAEFTYTTLDFLSNGFKVRNTGADINASGGNYIYMAFAENPFKNSLAR